MLVNEVSKYNVRVRVLAARRGDSVEAMTDSRHRMPVMRSRLQSGQLRGSRGSSLGCGTRMMPSLPCLTLAWWGLLVCGSVRSSSVAVPGRRQSRVAWRVRLGEVGWWTGAAYRAHAASSCRPGRRDPLR